MLSEYSITLLCFVVVKGTPSRAALITGRYPLTLGMQYAELQPAFSWGLNLSETMLPEILKEHGQYKSYAIGKWNVGHFTPQLLPTARGFDYFVGFLNGQNFHWSKRMPTQDSFRDFVVSDATCYAPYDGEDIHTYSTFLYRDFAVKAIESHDFDQNPMFLYVAFDAVHDPFDDLGTFPDGIPLEYFTADELALFENIQGVNRRQYAMSLKLMDNAVRDIYEALAAVKQEENTYVIVASDNGGCYSAGGRNGLLRGTKGTLFEGNF